MKSSAIAALLCSLPALAAAAPIGSTLIDFEGPTSFASIQAYYDGGADSAGATGPALGVVFGGDALALQNDALGPYFSNAPSPIGVMAPVGPDAAMDFSVGFFGALYFSYASSDVVSGGVEIWSDLGGTGTLLASFDLAANAQAGGCSDSAFCNFDDVKLSFDGIARSVRFGAAAGFAAFDDVAVTAIPVPASALLVALGLAGLAATRRRA